MSDSYHPVMKSEKFAACRVFDASTKLKPIDKLILSHITRLDNDQGAFISQRNLAKRVGTARATVQRCMDRLQDLGLLKAGYTEDRRTKTWYVQIPSECLSSSHKDAQIFECATRLDASIQDPEPMPGPDDWEDVRVRTSLNREASSNEQTSLNREASSAKTTGLISNTLASKMGRTGLTHEAPTGLTHEAAISDCIESVKTDYQQTEAPDGANCKAGERVQTRTNETDQTTQPAKRQTLCREPPAGYNRHPQLENQLIDEKTGRTLTLSQSWKIMMDAQEVA